MKNKNIKSLKAVSLVEMLITMALFGILSVMLLQSLLMNIKLSTQINLRARVRSELDQVQTLIERDIRNAEQINLASCLNKSCEMFVDGVRIQWQYYEFPHYVRKIKDGQEYYRSSPILYFTSGNFQVLYSGDDGPNKQKFVNVIVTLQAETNAKVVGCQKDSHYLDGCDNIGYDTQWVDDQIRQFSVSTRNYLIE